MAKTQEINAGTGAETLRDLTAAELADLAAVQQAAQSAAQAEAARLAEIGQDRGDLPALLTALADDRARLLDTAQSFTIAGLRVIMARMITLLFLIVRHERRTGL